MVLPQLNILNILNTFHYKNIANELYKKFGEKVTSLFPY